MESQRMGGVMRTGQSRPHLGDDSHNLEREGREVIRIKVPSYVTVEGNTEADRRASVGLHSHPLYPFCHTPHKEAIVPCAPPHKRTKTAPCTPTPLGVSQQIDVSVVSPKAISLRSAGVVTVLHSVDLEIMPDPDTGTGEEVDSGGSDTASTVTWAASSHGFSADVSDTRLFEADHVYQQFFAFYVDSVPLTARTKTPRCKIQKSP